MHFSDPHLWPWIRNITLITFVTPIRALCIETKRFLVNAAFENNTARQVYGKYLKDSCLDLPPLTLGQSSMEMRLSSYLTP